MEKITEIIDKLDFEEILRLRKEIIEGKAKKIIDNKLETFKNSNKVCPVCNSVVGDEGLTLLFGPPNFRKKATFDGTDCLEYFLYKIKNEHLRYKKNF